MCDLSFVYILCLARLDTSFHVHLFLKKLFKQKMKIPTEQMLLLDRHIIITMIMVIIIATE